MDASFVGLWTHEEAAIHNVEQLASSGCGATAAVTVLKVLNEPIPPLEMVLSASVLRYRKNDAPLAQYLASRSVAGCTGEEIVESVRRLSNNVKGEFVSFSSLPDTVRLVDWVANKIEEECCCVATLNLQLFGNDAWHHQLVYGVDKVKRLIYCTNPVEAYPEYAVMAMMSTPSILLIRKEDILKRKDRLGSDNSIYDDPLWVQYNVKDQVNAMSKGINCQDKHLVIPANYIGGFAVFNKIK